ncbi:hypothetical protein AAFO92_14095 [Roseovarius sp. CAU 1744]
MKLTNYPKVGYSPDLRVRIWPLFFVTIGMEMLQCRAALEYADPVRIITCKNCGMMPFPRNASDRELHALGAGTGIISPEPWGD